MDFQKFAAVHGAAEGDGVYADVVNHCRDYRTYLVAGDKPSSAHECTHGVNADLRNAAGAGYGVRYGLHVKAPRDARTCFAIKPAKACTQGSTTKAVNAFYLLRDRYVVVPEPSFRKSDVVGLIPAAFRGPRFELYVSGQAEWDGQPLYLWDEWGAYINGAAAAVDLAERGELKGGGTDWVYGPLEFVAYGLAVAVKADATGELVGVLRDTCRLQLTRAFNVYLAGKSYWPFPGQDEIYHALASGTAGSDFRDFMAKRLGFAVPDAVEPEDDGVGRSSFKVVGS